MITLISASIIFIAVAISLTLIRILAGPSVSDRVMALDTFTTITVALLVIISIILKRTIYIDVALIYAVIGFIGTLFVAKFIEKDI